MNLVEGIALFAVMVALRATRHVLDGRELRRWKRAHKFMLVQELNHGNIIDTVIDYKLAATVLEVELNRIIEQNDEQARSKIGESLDRYQRALDQFEIMVGEVTASERTLASVLRPEDVTSVVTQYDEWRNLIRQLRSTSNRLTTLRKTWVSIQIEK